ncbi:unnamed protein product, partial [Closterium sp. NIES-53]
GGAERCPFECQRAAEGPSARGVVGAVALHTAVGRAAARVPLPLPPPPPPVRRPRLHRRRPAAHSAQQLGGAEEVHTRYKHTHGHC